MTKPVRLVLVTNSVPLPATDFLKHKVIGLSQKFDLHLTCWGSEHDKQTFCNSYNIPPGHVHLFYNKWSVPEFINLLFINFFRILFSPGIAIPLLWKLLKVPKQDLKTSFIKFCLYFPIAKLKPEVVHFEYGTLAHRFSDIKSFIHCKTSVSFRGYDINYVGLGEGDYYKDVWHNIDAFHFLGNDLKQRAMARGYTARKMEALIPPAIDTDFFNYANTTKNEVFTIISVGRLAWKKGYEYGLRAVKLLKQKGIRFRYDIYATGDYLQPVLFAIKELGLEEEVTIIQPSSQTEIKDALAKAHVFLHPAISEGFSNAVLEAQSMQLPVVATDADGLPENIEDGITGFIVPVYDATAISEKLELLYKDVTLRTRMGINGRERVLNNFKLETQLEKFKVFYCQLADAES